MQLAWIHLAIYLALLYWECTFVGFAVRPRRVHSLLFSLPLFPSVCTEPAQIQFYCIYLFIYSYLFSISEASYQRPPNLRSRVAGEPPGLHLSPYERVCVCVFRDKIKIQMERKHWNHHFSYRQLRGLRLPLLTNSSRVMKQKALKCTHFMTHRISFK